MWRHFNTKQKSYEFTLCDCVWLCAIVWFTLTLNFWYSKLKKRPHFFLRFRSYVTMQGICNKFIEMKISVENGLAVILSVATLNICQILMRFNTLQGTHARLKQLLKENWATLMSVPVLLITQCRCLKHLLVNSNLEVKKEGR